jgi:hypothetical protein
MGLLLSTVLDIVVQSLQNWFAGGIWKGLEMQAREVLECAKWCLMDNSGEDSEDQDADRNADSEVSAEVSCGKKDSFGNWTKGHLYYILAKNLSAFCSFPESLCETEFIGRRLIHLMGNISSQYSWILMGAFSQIYMSIGNQKQSKRFENLFWLGKKHI